MGVCDAEAFERAPLKLCLLNHIDVHLVEHIGIVFGLAEAQAGNIDILRAGGKRRKKLSIVDISLYRVYAYISTADMSASGCTIQMSVQLVEHIAQTLHALLVGLNQYGLEVDRQAVPG